MVEFNWLHLTDLHLGMKGSEDLWPGVEEDFFDDLKDLIKDERGPRVDPLDLVLFTGDLVQSGSVDQFDEINVVLERLWERFHKEMGFKPKLLVVPGNHDLTRPPESTGKNPNPVLDTLMHLWHFPHVYEAFWDPESPHRKLVSEAFKNYVEWWQHIPPELKPEVYWKGELPGDFSATIQKHGVKLGIVGLNSTFLQLKDADREHRLALSGRQFNLACGGHGPDWAGAHNLCLLLTHHPPEWLTEAARGKLAEIHKPPRFALHLFGHLHKAELTYRAEGGTDGMRQLQGSSLFSLEQLGNEATDRRHGYSLGQLKITDSDPDYAELRIWPRHASQLPDRRWSFGDERSFALRMDHGTKPEKVQLPRRLGNYSYPEDQRSDADEELVIELVTTDKEKKFQTIDPAIVALDPILIARLDMLQQKLSRIPRWLESDLEKLGVGKSFKKTLLAKNIGRPLNIQKNSLGDICTKLKELKPNKKKSVSEALKAAWSDYQKVYRESQGIFRDCLELMGGLALRDKKLDERICEVADELINDTTDYVSTTWHSFTVLAQREAFQWTISRIIRLRFPEWTIWSLPFAANEFGHVVIRDEHMFEDLVAAQANESKKRHLIVILADAFATYVMGPAYVCAAISLWLNPSEPFDEAASSETSDQPHLSDATRASVMFAVLNRMNDRASDDSGEEPYEEIICLLKQRWGVALQRQDKTSSQPSEEIQVWDSQDLEELVDTALRKLDDWLSEDGVYPHSGKNGIKVAEAWAGDWEEQLSNGKRLSIPEPSAKSTLRDALNAAWLCRSRGELDKVDLVAEAAYQLCEEIIDYKPADAGGPVVGQPPSQSVRHQVASRRQGR